MERLSAKMHLGPGGINCDCCRPGRGANKANKQDVKVMTARSNRRIVRHTIRKEFLEKIDAE